MTTDPTALQARIAALARAIDEAVGQANRQHAIELREAREGRHREAEARLRAYTDNLMGLECPRSTNAQPGA